MQLLSEVNYGEIQGAYAENRILAERLTSRSDLLLQ